MNGNDALQRLNYDEQIFSLASPEPRKFTFEDSFEIDPGSYRVELTLWRVVPDRDLASLRADGHSHSNIVLRDSEKVTVVGPQQVWRILPRVV